MAALLRSFSALLLVSSCVLVEACPPPGLPPPARYVGDVATDSKCTDNDIQSAINNASCPNTFIVISREHTYTQQHLSINNKSIILTATGNGVACNAGGGGAGGGGSTPTAPLVTINGNGSQSVFDISGNSNVTFQYLEITGGGGNSGSYGGGVHFDGTGSLNLDTATIDGNRADFGGGLAVAGIGGNLALALKKYSLILNNTAGHDGGGIHIEGSARLYMLEDASTIAFNHADSGEGGGVDIIGPARADIASPGAVLTGAVSNNSAALGGGISAIATPGGSAVARLFSTSASRPVLLSQNTATQRGGAVYLKPNAQDGVNIGASLCAYDFRINSNTAPDGAAIYADFDSGDQEVGSGVSVNPSGDCGPESPASLGAVACAASSTCNEISDNGALDTHGQPVGPVVNVNHSSFAADRFAMRGNTAAQLININFGISPSITNCLIADNHSVHELVHSNSGNVLVDNCTIARNAIDNGYVFFSAGDFTVTHSIINESGVQTFDTPGGCCLNASNTISNDISTFPADAGFILQVDDPLFVDATNPDVNRRDYHLRAYVQDGNIVASPAMDYAPPVAGDDRDLDDNPHDQDVPLVTDAFGIRDLGCYEAQPVRGRIFADAFGDPVSLVQ